MKIFSSSIIFLFLIFSPYIYSQGEGALATTTLQQSTMLLGAGQIGAAVPNDDVLGYYLNPAILGYSAKNNHVSISFMPSETNWFSFGFYKPTYNNYGLNIGYNLKNTQLDLPISLGFGFLNSDFTYGDFIVTSEFGPEPIANKEIYDRFNCFSFGVGFDFLIDLNVGISLKSFESQLSSGVWSNGQFKPYKADGTMWDFGLIAIAPISEYLFDKTELKVNNALILKPISQLSIGYSFSNYGDEIYYVNESQKDPLSRTARLGYSLNLGFDAKFDNIKVNFMNYYFTSEVQDILVKNSLEDGFEYQGIFGDMNIIDNIIGLNSDENVIVHKGHVLQLFETITITSGRFYGHGYSSTRETSGIGISTKGIFKLINQISEDRIVDYITNHIHIDYQNANVQFFEGIDTNFKHISLHFRGFEI